MTIEKCFICDKELPEDSAYIEAQRDSAHHKKRHFCYNHYSEIAVIMNNSISEMLKKEGGE